MKVLITQLQESVLCTFANGEEIEFTMLCAYGEEVAAVPDIKLALELLREHSPVIFQHSAIVYSSVN